MDLSQTVKRLRRAQDMTQETVAEYLGVSPQAVSRWETGQAMPDITLLPALANLFDVTADELLGINERKNKQHMDNVFSRVQQLRSQSQFTEAADLLRSELALFPRNYGLMSELAFCLCGGETPSPQAIDEAITLCERVLAGSESEKLRSTTRSLLVLLYYENGQREKASNLIRSFPHIWESREMMLAAAGEDEALRSSLHLLLALAVWKIQHRTLSDEKNLLGQGLPPATQSPQELLRCLAEFFREQHSPFV